MKIISVCILAILVAGCATTRTNPGYSPVNSDSSWVTVSSSPSGASTDTSVQDENMAIQQMNDANALTASMQAAQQQNDAAVAATQQTEINAGF